MKTVAIVGNGPSHLLPDFAEFNKNIDLWIGADRGALHLAAKNIQPYYAVGDFDSITEEEKLQVKSHAIAFEEYPVEKDETDMEIALKKAFMFQPECIYLFGVTGGRLDHELVNIQLLYSINQKGIRGIIVDQQNQLELTSPGTHTVTYDEKYPAVSFIPYTSEVEGLTLSNFYYPLINKKITWGSSLCISNKLLSKKGTFSYTNGILLLVKSKDTISW